MLVRQLVEGKDAPFLGRVSRPDDALKLSWVKALYGRHVWEPDEHGHGFVISLGGRIIATIERERGEK